MIKAVIFDLDGTLLNTIQDLANACNWALGQMGLPRHTVEEYKQFVGSGRRNLILRMLPAGQSADPAAVERASSLFDEYYAAHLQDTTAPYPGIPQLIARLREKGLLLGVVSNKPHEFTSRIVEQYFPGLFDQVAGQQGALVKPDPAGVNRLLAAFGVRPDEALYVGDSGVDIKTAQNAKTQSCGVTWGFRDEAELRGAGAEVIAAHPEEIAALVEGRNRTGRLRRGLALFTAALMLLCLAGLAWSMATGNGAGVAACVALPLLLGFAARGMLRQEDR